MTKRKELMCHIFALFCVLVWGTTFISTKFLLNSFHPVVILLYRLIICVTLLFIIHPRIFKTFSFKHELLFIGAGASGVTFYFLFENMALSYTTASDVGIIVSAAPFFTLIFCTLFLKTDRITIWFIIGFILAMSGIILISINGSSNLNANPIGYLLALIAMVMWGFYSVFVKKIGDLGYKGIGSTRKIMYYGLIFLVPFFFIFRCNFNFSAFNDYRNILNILFLGILASTMCFVLWNYSLRNIGAVKTSVYIYLSPVVTVIASAIFLKEQITIFVIIGMVLAISGLIISSINPRKRLKSDA
ncbi:MAG: DMT family transporter [Acholeplasmatales bacterium]|nr:DMT family transporter [Acholeplasmatales bacterium]